MRAKRIPQSTVSRAFVLCKITLKNSKTSQVALTWLSLPPQLYLTNRKTPELKPEFFFQHYHFLA